MRLIDGKELPVVLKQGSGQTRRRWPPWVARWPGGLLRWTAGRLAPEGEERPITYRTITRGRKTSQMVLDVPSQL